MALITLPTQFMVCRFNMPLQVNQRVGAAPFAGSEEVVDLLNDRWTISLTVEWRSLTEANYIEAFIASMRSRVNTVNLPHFVRKVPYGTARGAAGAALNLAVTAAQGAPSISVSGASPANGTLLAGDMLGLTTAGGAQLLVMVANDTTFSGGAATVPIANRLRAQCNSGTANVVWNGPTAPFRMLSTSGVQYDAFSAEQTTFDFVEAI